MFVFFFVEDLDQSTHITNKFNKSWCTGDKLLWNMTLSTLICKVVCHEIMFDCWWVIIVVWSSLCLSSSHVSCFYYEKNNKPNSWVSRFRGRYCCTSEETLMEEIQVSIHHQEIKALLCGWLVRDCHLNRDLHVFVVV